MSFGGAFGGGFGSNNNNTQSTGFGSGFGQNNTSTTTGGFGSTNTGGGFGQSGNTGSGVFGSTNTNTGGGFGQSASGSAFGSKPAFGSSNTGGGLFGSSNTNTTTNSTGFGGGFGSTNNATTTASPFGSNTASTGGGLFGGAATSQPAFGAAATTTGNSLFGGSASTTQSGFGSGFGGSSTTALGGSTDPPGTANTPFQAHTEKESSSSSLNNAFQNIGFQDPYKKWSAEELRLADYVQGRRHGNATGGGAFGVGSNFGGGFGATNTQTNSAFGTNNTTTGGGLFGSGNTNTATTGFGQTANTGFGASTTNTTGGGLFGAAQKPAGGLFGNTGTQQTTNAFGSTTGTGFGATNTNAGSAFGSSTTGGGLFGANNNAAKPAGGLFGGGNTTTASTGFGATPSTNAFGSNTAATGGTGLFGSSNATNTQATGGGLFGGGNTQQQSTGSAFGSGFGQTNQNQASTGMFGNAQAKPATGGLFGTPAAQPAATGGGLFGNNVQQQTTSAFGGTANNTAAGGLFGAGKPATGGLFGAGTNTAANTTAGGLFGGGLGAAAQPQQATGTGLFGASSAAQQQKTGLFGTPTSATGGGLFASAPAQNAGSSLFGATNTQQQTAGLGTSILGASQQVANAPQGLTANLSDVSAYGSPSLFAGINGSEVANPGPLATPLNGSAKPKRGSILAMSKMTPASSSRYGTPQKRGFGFSYSTYGTPGASPASSIASTPGNMTRSLIGSSSSSSLRSSVSSNNLRRNFNTDDSILAPGAFSTSSGPRWYGSTGSRKLVINRDIRSDLFTTPTKDKPNGDIGAGSRKLTKRVSFDTSNVDDEPVVRGALPAPEDSSRTDVDETTPRQTRYIANTDSFDTPQGDRSKSADLSVVSEEDSLSTPNGAIVSGDLSPGAYYTSPSLQEIQNMSPKDKARIPNFVVGRENVGTVAFLRPVDFTNVSIDQFFGEIIILEPRSATVYPDASRKPIAGKGLNQPARISLEQSWPRSSRDRRASSDSSKYAKHCRRLKSIPDTTFESYDQTTGVWVFTVEHFTTYGLDDSEDESDMDVTLEPVNAVHTQVPTKEAVLDVSVNSFQPDDTMEFRESRSLIPGAFDEQDDMMVDMTPKQSFLGDSSVDSVPNEVQLSLDEYTADMGDEYDLSDEEDMARSSVGQHLATEQEDASSENGQEMHTSTPGGVLRARMRAMKDSIGPVRLEVADGDDWAEMLRKTASPVKRDRRLLKERNESPSRQYGALIDFGNDEQIGRSSVWGKKSRAGRMDFQPSAQVLDKGRGFATSIDLMNSLFEKPKATGQQTFRASQNFGASIMSAPRGFPKWPYERQDKTLTIDEKEQAFHNAGRPTWGPDETLVLTRVGGTPNLRQSRGPTDILAFNRPSIQTGRQTVRMGKFSVEPSKNYLIAQDSLTKISLVDGVPAARLHAPSVMDVFHHQDMKTPTSLYENRVWKLASILFDDSESPRTRKANLSTFWTDLVDSACSTAVGLAGSHEEKAVACLAGHRVPSACKHLLEGKNFRLATLVPLIGKDDQAKRDMREQVQGWYDAKMLSEFSEPIRAIYELLSGNVCFCEGMKSVPVEDRFESFVISEKFGLDWKQAFGLRLWYAISQSDDLAVAVGAFKADIEKGKEKLPQPWYREQGLPVLWEDANASKRQDLLWGLLELYSNPEADLEAIIRSENSQLSPLDYRLRWQLGLALTGTGKVSFGKLQKEKADAATISYASQLSGAGEWLESIFVLLHLSDTTARKQAIQDCLCRHAGLIGPESGSTFGVLVEKYQIPSAWIWEALAMYNWSVKKDAGVQVQCLLKAGSFVAAHGVLVEKVAPLAIIERGYSELSALISQLQTQQSSIPGWQLGGEMYSLFLQLLQHRSRGESCTRPMLDKLLTGLHAMSEDGTETEIMKYAAISEMADETAKEILRLTRKKQDSEFRSRILQLPLTQDRLLAYSVDLGMERYRNVMSH